MKCGKTLAKKKKKKNSHQNFQEFKDSSAQRELSVLLTPNCLYIFFSDKDNERSTKHSPMPAQGIIKLSTGAKSI